MISVSVFKPTGLDDEYAWTDWWINFRKYYLKQGYDIDNEDNNDDLTRALLEWNAINESDTEFFKFEDERDYTLFMLRWA